MSERLEFPEMRLQSASSVPAHFGQGIDSADRNDWSTRVDVAKINTARACQILRLSLMRR